MFMWVPCLQAFQGSEAHQLFLGAAQVRSSSGKPNRRKWGSRTLGEGVRNLFWNPLLKGFYLVFTSKVPEPVPDSFPESSRSSLSSVWFAGTTPEQGGGAVLGGGQKVYVGNKSVPVLFLMLFGEAYIVSCQDAPRSICGEIFARSVRTNISQSAVLWTKALSKFEGFCTHLLANPSALCGGSKSTKTHVKRVIF